MKLSVTSFDDARSVQHWLAFTFIVFVMILLRVMLFQGYSNSDPLAYTHLADDLAHGVVRIPSYNSVPVFPLRLGVYGPVALVIKILGVSELTLVAYPLVVSIAACLVGYLVARCLFSPFAGLLSMAILAALPFNLFTSSILYPDPIAAFWANVGILLILVPLSKNSDLRFPVYELLAGICFGLSWLCKESVVYLAPFIGFLCLQRKTTNERLLTIVAVGIGSFAVLLIELSFYKVITGDPLFRFHAIERNYETASMWFFNQSSPYFGWEEGGYFRAVTRRLFLEGPNTILRMFSNLPALAMLSTAWALVFRNRRFLIPAAWFLSLCFMFNFMSSSFQAYRPLPVFDRYLYPLILPSALLFAGLLSTLVLTDFPSDLRRERRFWAWALILPFCGLFAIRTVDIFREGRPEQVARDVASRVGGGDTVYTDARTASSLVFFRTGKLLLSDSNTIPYEGVPARSMKDCAYVLVDRNVLDFLTKSYEYEQPAFVGAEDRSWHRVFSRDNAALFKIDHGHCH